MAVSGSTDFSSTAVTILEDARRLLGVHAEEESLEAHELQTGIRFLTRMLKEWEVDPALGTWLYTEGSLALVDGDGAYTFQAGGDVTTVPFEIVHVRVSTSAGASIPLQRISREDYYRLPTPTSEGRPTQWFYDRQRDGGTLYLWPVPDSNDHDITYTYRRRIMDVDAGTDNLDIPPEWEEAVVNNLAVKLIPVYGRGGSPEAAQIITQAELSLGALKSFDVANDEGAVEILPDPFYYRSDWRR